MNLPYNKKKKETSLHEKRIKFLNEKMNRPVLMTCNRICNGFGNIIIIIFKISIGKYLRYYINNNEIFSLNFTKREAKPRQKSCTMNIIQPIKAVLKL